MTTGDHHQTFGCNGSKLLQEVEPQKTLLVCKNFGGKRASRASSRTWRETRPPGPPLDEIDGSCPHRKLVVEGTNNFKKSCNGPVSASTET